ncbi:MAG TPA: glycosyltransferase family 4 protein [Candidatus Saccharimonadales bacterium]|nr:glycosyltransferase family 4 protein [Candidatus Saccharimonadales bacterium]
MLGWELPPHNSGGLGVACYQMAKALSIKGVSIDFVLPYQHATTETDYFKVHSAVPISPEVVSQNGGAYAGTCQICKVRDCQHAWSHDLRARQRQYITYVEQLVTKNPPEVIHAHDWLTFEAGMRAKEITGRPLIAHVHATEFDRAGANTGNPMIHDIEYTGLLLADKIIAVSQTTKDLIIARYNIPTDKIEVVHNSIDLSEYDATEGPDNAYQYVEAMKRRGYTVVATVGRLTIQKGLHYFLQAARKVIDRNEKVLFLIAGSGEQRDELLEQAADLGIARNILFSGFVRGKQWRDTYRVADIFVMSSVSEPFGLTALEAAHYGTAVSLSCQSGVGEILHNVLKFDYWDTERLADQILALAQYQALTVELQDSAFAELQHFSWHEAADKLLQLYQRSSNVAVGVAT